jgi:hypothetical protein
MRATMVPDGGSCSYAGTGYANPHAVTQTATGYSTTTFQFDNNGNVLQKLTDGVLTTYAWDYANRLIAIGSGGASTTYAYDALPASFANWHFHHKYLSFQVVLGRFIDGKRCEIFNDHGICVQRR